MTRIEQYCDIAGVTLEDMLNRSRKKHISRVRALYWKLRRETSSDTMEVIGLDTGNAISAVNAGLNRIDRLIDEGGDDLVELYQKALPLFPPMSVAGARNCLIRHNQWRRGKLNRIEYKPSDIGRAIDIMVSR